MGELTNIHLACARRLHGATRHPSFPPGLGDDIKERRLFHAARSRRGLLVQAVEHEAG